MFDILCLYDNYSGLEECMKDRLGRPDLIIFKDNELIFVEVKTGQDGLRADQLRWMSEHNNFKIVIFYLNQIVKDEEGN